MGGERLTLRPARLRSFGWGARIPPPTYSTYVPVHPLSPACMSLGGRQGYDPHDYIVCSVIHSLGFPCVGGLAKPEECALRPMHSGACAQRSYAHPIGTCTYECTCTHTPPAHPCTWHTLARSDASHQHWYIRAFTFTQQQASRASSAAQPATRRIRSRAPRALRVACCAAAGARAVLRRLPHRRARPDRARRRNIEGSSRAARAGPQ